MFSAALQTFFAKLSSVPMPLALQSWDPQDPSGIATTSLKIDGGNRCKRWRLLCGRWAIGWGNPNKGTKALIENSIKTMLSMA